MSDENYADDFEDYEDDFEESESEKESVKEEENTSESLLLQKLANRQKVEPISKPHSVSVSSISIPAVTFSSINISEHDLHQQRGKERLEKLRGLISIESSRTSVYTDATFDIYPALGTERQVNAITQTGDEGVSEEVQTEIATTETIATQHPPQHTVRNDDVQLQYDRKRLKNFVAAAAQVTLSLLEKSTPASDEDQMRENGNFKFSRGHNSFQIRNISKKHKVTALCPGEQNTVLCAYQILESPSPILTDKSLIVEFYLHRKGPPKRVYLADGTVAQMTTSPNFGVVYAALTDGSFCGYDNNDPDSKFKDSIPWVDSKSDLPLRRPAFDSSFLAATISDASPLVALVVTPSYSGEQVVTIDTRGTLQFWASDRVNNNLTPQLTAVIRPHQHLLRNSGQFNVNCMAASMRPLMFFVGCDSGMIYSQTRQGTTDNIPKIYRTESKQNGEVTSIDTNPKDSSVFVAGFSTGRLVVYKTGQLTPLVWLSRKGGSQRVTSVFFNPREPMVIHSLTSGKVMISWDLTKDTSSILSEKIDEVHFLLLNSENVSIKDSETSCNTIWYRQQEGRYCYLAIGGLNGGLDVHAMENMSTPTSETMGQILRRLRNFV